MGSRPDPPHSALTLLVQASRVSPELRAAVAEVEEYINAQVTDYDDATDCVVCAQLATDRDDALREIDELRTQLQEAAGPRGSTCVKHGAVGEEWFRRQWRNALDQWTFWYKAYLADIGTPEFEGSWRPWREAALTADRAAKAAAVRSWEMNNEIDRLIGDRDVYASALRDMLCAESGGAHLLPVEWEDRIAPLVWRWDAARNAEAG